MDKIDKEKIKERKKEFDRKMKEIRPFLKKKYVKPDITADKWDTDSKKRNTSKNDNQYVKK